MRENLAIYVAGTDAIFFFDEPFSVSISEIDSYGVYFKSSVLSFGEIQTSIDLRNPVSTSGGCSFTVPRQIYYATNTEQPEIMFGGVLPPGGSLRVMDFVSTNANQISVDSYVEEGFYHLGLELLYCYNYNSDYGLVNVERGRLGTLAQPHFINAALGQYPVLTSYPTAWVGRPIYIFNQNGIWRKGFLTSAPVFAVDTITINWAPIDVKISSNLSSSQIAPVTTFADAHYVSSPLKIGQVALIDGPIGLFSKNGTSFTRIDTNAPWSASWQYFVNPTLDSFFNAGQKTPAWPIFGTKFDPVTYGSAVTFTVNDSTSITASLSTSLPDGEVYLYGGGRYFLTPSIGTAGQTITNADIATALNNFYRSTIPTNINNLDPIAGLFTNDTHSDCYQWKIKVTGNLTSSSVIPGGLFWGLVWSETEFSGDSDFTIINPEADLLKEFNDAGGPINTCKLNISAGTTTLHYSQMLKDESLNAYDRQHAGVDFDEWTWDGVSRYPLRIIGLPPARGTPENYDLSVQGVNGIKSHITFFNIEPPFTSIPNVLLAKRWWEYGEKFIFLRDSLSDGEFACKATWFEPGKESECSCILYLENYSPYSGGYLYKVLGVNGDESESSRPAGIGDWQSNRASFRRIPRTPWQRDYIAIKNVLCSTDGSDPIFTIYGGLGFPIEWLDAESIERFCLYSPGFREFVFDLTEKTAAEAFLPILLLSNTALIGKYKNNDYVISRVPVGDMYGGADWFLSDDDFIGLPESTTFQDIVTQYQVIFKTVNNKDTVDIFVTDTDAVQIFGCGGTLTVNLDCCFPFTSSTDVENLAKTYFSRWIRCYGKPQREWVLKIPFSKGKDFNLCDIIEVTSKYLYGNSPGRGVNDQRARIVELTQDPVNDLTTIRARVQAINTGCYCKSITVWIYSTSPQVKARLYPEYKCFGNPNSFDDLPDEVWRLVDSNGMDVSCYIASMTVQSDYCDLVLEPGDGVFDIGWYTLLYEDTYDDPGYFPFDLGVSELR